MSVVLLSETAQEVMALWGEMESFYGGSWAKMLSANDLYSHNFTYLEDTVPEGVDIHSPSTASSVIDVFRDNVRVDVLVPNRDDWGISKKAREAKALLLRLDAHIIKQTRNQSSVDPFAQAAFDMPLRGAAAWRIGYDKTRWPEEMPEHTEEQHREFLAERGLSWPITITPVDPLSIAPAPGGHWPLPWCIEYYKLSVEEARQRYPNWPTVKVYAPGIILDCYEFWEAPSTASPNGLFIIVIDGQEADRGPNPFGFTPYVFEYSGWGRLNYDNDPANLAVNLLEKAESEIRAEARLKTAMDAAWQFTVFPRLLTTEDPRSVKIRWDLSSGGILQVQGLASDQRPIWLEQPQIDSAMYQFLPVVQQSIQRATYSSALEGNRQPGVDFGYLQSLLVGQASLRKDAVIRSLQRMFSRGVELSERALVHLDIGPLLLGPGTDGERERMVSPNDIGNRFETHIKIEAADPSERDRKMLAWLSPLRAGAISKRTYLSEGMGRTDPDEELAAVYEEAVVEQLLKSGVVAQTILQELAVEEQIGTLQKGAEDAVQRSQRAREAAREGATPIRAPGTPTPQEQPMEQSPLSAVKAMQSVNQRATSLERGG